MIRTLCWPVFFLILASSASAIDLELSSRFDTLYWSPTRIDNAAGRTFQGADLFWNVEGSVTQELGDGLLFQGGVEIDPILRWRAYAKLGFALDNLSLRFSPFLGTFNSLQKWFNPGLDAEVEYTWPGFLFVRGGFLTTFAPVAKTGDYYLSSQGATVGTLMANGIISFHIEDKSATFRTSDTATTVDASTRYWLDTEMFLKNFPLRWALVTGYQVTSRSYIGTVETVTALHSPLLGARVSWDFGSGTVVYLEAESAFFNVGWNSTIMNVPATASIYQAIAGVRYHW